MWRQYLTAKIAKEIEHRIQTKEKWDKTISVPVDILPEEIAAQVSGFLFFKEREK